MRVFLDTNILVDVVEQRLPFYPASQAVLDRRDQLGCSFFIAPHGLATVFYLSDRKLGAVGATDVVRQILSWAEVANLGDAEARRALTYGIPDYEDALQAAAAGACGADWLVTRDATGFVGCPVSVLSPDEFLKRFPAPSAGNQGPQP